jgi:hypothetical protein
MAITIRDRARDDSHQHQSSDNAMLPFPSSGASSQAPFDGSGSTALLKGGLRLPE